eukprot:UN03934
MLSMITQQNVFRLVYLSITLIFGYISLTILLDMAEMSHHAFTPIRKTNGCTRMIKIPTYVISIPMSNRTKISIESYRNALKQLK